MATISVVIPVYNVEAYLDRCMESLLGQQAGDMEIILVDDGSKDASPAICDRYAAQDPRVRVIHKENGGAAMARNAGLAAATGTYVSFIDSDDWVDPDLFSKIADILAVQQPDMIRFGYHRVKQGVICVTRKVNYEPGLYTGDELEPVRLDSISFANVLDYTRARSLSVWAGVYRLELLRSNGIEFRSEREILNEDYLLDMQVTHLAQSVIFMEDCPYYYDCRPNSLTTVYRPNMFERKQRLYDCYCEFLKEPSAEQQIRLINFYIDGAYNSIQSEASSSRTPAEAIGEIRRILADEKLAEYLKQNRARVASGKSAVIYWMMRLKMAVGMYYGYRLIKK